MSDFDTWFNAQRIEAEDCSGHSDKVYVLDDIYLSPNQHGFAHEIAHASGMDGILACQNALYIMSRAASLPKDAIYCLNIVRGILDQAYRIKRHETRD